MKLETIYNELLDIMKSEMDFTKALKLKEKLEKAIREETCYKTTSKTRVNAIKRVASKLEIRPSLKGYGVINEYKYVTDSYHAIKIKEESMPLKLVTTDDKLISKIGKDNCIIGTFPNVEQLMNFNKEEYKTITLDFNDIESYYKMHKKRADKEPYKLENINVNICYLKNVIDVLGKDIIVYVPTNDIRPVFIENKDNEVGCIVPIKVY